MLPHKPMPLFAVRIPRDSHLTVARRVYFQLRYHRLTAERSYFRKIKWAPWVRYGYAPTLLSDILNSDKE